MVARNEVLVRFLGDAAGLQRTVGQLDNQMKGFSRTVSRATQLVAAATLTGIGASVKSFASFEDAMVQSQAIMGDLTDTMKRDMNAAAREVGITTRLSATEAAESFFFLASAGLDAEQSIAAMPQVAQFAQAGMFDMARATDLATDAQSALGLTVDDAAQNTENLVRVMDTLVGANTLANASVEQFSAALTQDAAASLRLVNKDIEEGVAVLAVWADQGLKGEAAGTALGIVMRDLQIKSTENAGKFAAAGVAVFDAAGEMRNMADIVSDLEDAFDHLSPEDRVAALRDLGFSDRNLKRLTQLLGTSEQIREYEAELRQMSGITEEVSAKQLQSLSAQWDLFKGQVEDVAIGIGEFVAPVILSAMGSILSWWDENGEALRNGALRAFGAISDWWSENGGFVMGAIEGSLRRIGTLAGSVFTVLETFWNNHGAVVMELMATAFRGVRRIADRVVKAIAGWFEQYGPAIAGVLGDIAEGVNQSFGKLSEWWNTNGADVEAGIGFLAAGLGGLIQGLDGSNIGTHLLTSAMDVLLWTIDGLRLFIDTAADLLVALGFVLGDLIIDIVDFSSKTAAKISEWAGKVQGFIQDVGEELDLMWQDFVSVLTGVISVPSDMFSGIVGAFRAAINGLIRIWNDLEFVMPGVSVPGFGTFGGFSLTTPNIPLLANGAVTNANDPFLAVVGDNKTQREIIAPEDTLREIFQEVLNSAGGLEGPGATSADTNVNIEQVNMNEIVRLDELSNEFQWAMKTMDI